MRRKMSITEQFKQKKKDKYVDAHTLYKKIKTLLKKIVKCFMQILKQKKSEPPRNGKFYMYSCCRPICTFQIFTFFFFYLHVYIIVDICSSKSSARKHII